MKTYAERIRRLRKGRGLSQEELAARLGVSRSAVGMYETGKREPDFATWETIADLFDVDMDYLMGRGLSREQAQDLFVRALFDDALIEAAHPLARKAVFERAAATLGQEVARDLIDTLGIELPANAEPTAPTTREDASNA